MAIGNEDNGNSLGSGEVGGRYSPAPNAGLVIVVIVAVIGIVLSMGFVAFWTVRLLGG